MLDIFNPSATWSRGQVVIGRFEYVRRQLQQNLSTAINWHRQNPQSVATTHILSRFLASTSVPLSLDVRTYKDRFADMALNRSMSMQMTSILAKGEMTRNGSFYGKGSNEVVIADISDFDVSDIENTWQDLEPVRVLRHPSTDLNMPFPNGRNDFGGISVFLVNLPMLGAQFKMWSDAQGAYPDRNMAIVQFLTQLPLANMMRSQLDVALFNRMLYLLMGLDVPKTRNTNSFALNDYHDLVNDVLEQYVHVSKTRRADFPAMIAALPAITKNNVREVMDFKLPLRNRYVNWAITLAHIPVISYLVQANDGLYGEVNQRYLNEIAIGLKIMESDRSLKGGLDDATFDKSMDEINNNISRFLNVPGT